MAKMHSIRVNFILNFLLKASGMLFSLISFSYVSRILLVAGTGKVAFAASIVGYFSTVAALGIPIYGIRACAQVRDDRRQLSKTVQELMFIHGIMTLSALAIFVLMISTIPQIRAERTLYAVFGFNIFLGFLGVEWLYAALEQYSFITTRSILFKAAAMLLMLLFIRNVNDYVVYGALTVFANIGSNVVNFIHLRKYVDLRPSGRLHIKKHLKPIFIFFAQTIAITVYTNLDTVMLGIFKTEYDVGLYDAAVKCKIILVNLITALGTVLLPRLSYYIQKDMQADYWRQIKRAGEFVLLVSLPVVIFFIVEGADCILLLSGDPYLGALPALRIIMPTLLFIGLSNITGIQILTPHGKEKFVLYSVSIGAAVNFVLNLILIPKLGAAGTALGTLTAEIVVLLTQLWFLKDFRKQLIGIPIIRSFIAAILPAFAAYGVSRLEIPVVSLRFLLSGIAFFTIWFLALFVLKEPLFMEFVSRRKN
jgi:O-antigen/teichoic acid export membrane protein